MTAEKLIEMLKKVPPTTRVIIGVEGYHCVNPKVERAKQKTYRGGNVKYPDAIVIMDDAAIEDLGIF